MAFIVIGGELPPPALLRNKIIIKNKKKHHHHHKKDDSVASEEAEVLPEQPIAHGNGDVPHGRVSSVISWSPFHEFARPLNQASAGGPGWL